ncbi:MAG: molybdopterin-dependent oxidoreductase [Desulfobacterales bacterium]
MNSRQKMDRRKFMALAGGTVAGLALPGIFIKLTEEESHAMASELRPDGRPRIPPGQHAVKAIVDMGGIQRPGGAADWKLKIHGEVKKPTSITSDQLMALSAVDVTCDVHCVTGWTLLDSRWRGIRLTALMDLAEVDQNAAFVIFESYAGYTSNIPISEARKQNVILAHSFFGKPLPAVHGAPLRALVPDLYFYKSAKWLEGVKFTVKDEPGYWERGGYSNSADPWKEDRFKNN